MSKGKYPHDWDKRRRKVIQRDGWECQNCNTIPEATGNTAFHVHHVKPISEGGGHAYENLITLCEGCHHEIHSEQDGPLLEPVEVSVCTVCSNEYTKKDGYDPQFCSGRCHYQHRAGNLLTGIRNEEPVCATCFTPTSRYDGNECRNCGNPVVREHNADLVGDFDVDVESLVAAVLVHIDTKWDDERYNP